MVVTFGSDPEVLFTDMAGDFRSVEGLLPGTKDNPHPVHELGSVLVDNVAGEFNTRPSATPLGFMHTTRTVRDILFDMASCKGLTPSKKSVARYHNSQTKTALTNMAGCDVDWNVYTGELNPIPDYSSDSLRSAGGHLHIGCALAGDAMLQFIKALDLMIAVPMMCVDHPDRRTLYGRAGSIRVKSYGVEYRTPSNHWIFDEATCLWVVEQIKLALDKAPTLDLHGIDLQHIIDSHDTTTAQQVMSYFNIPQYGA